MQNEKVSVIVPLYNSRLTITETILSLVGQTYQNLEIILVDDGSTDNTANIVKEFTAEYSNIKYFWKENGGVGAARNYGIDRATGGYIALCDHDDLWMPDKLEKQMKLFTNDRIGLVYNGCRTVKVVDGVEESIAVTMTYYSGNCFDQLLRFNCIPTCSAVIPRRVINRTGGFHESIDMHGVDDKHLWLRIAHDYDVVALKEILSIRRVTGRNWSMNEAKMLRSAINCLDDIKSMYCNASNSHLFDMAYYEAYSHYAGNLFLIDDFLEARQAYLRAIAFNRKQKLNYLRVIATYLPVTVIRVVRGLRIRLIGQSTKYISGA